MKAVSIKGFGNGKATLDNGYGLFLNMLEYKFYDQVNILLKQASGFHQVIYVIVGNSTYRDERLIYSNNEM